MATIRCFCSVFPGNLSRMGSRLDFARYIALLLYQVKAAQAYMLAMPVLAILGITVLATQPVVVRASH